MLAVVIYFILCIAFIVFGVVSITIQAEWWVAGILFVFAALLLCIAFSKLDDEIDLGTSAMIQSELDSIINQYTDKFCNPMVMWGRYRKHWFKTTLPISFQFHHVQMDGGHGAAFLEQLQQEIKKL